MPAPEPLSPTDIGRLELERLWFSSSGSKEAAIFDRFGESMTQYYQRLNVLLDDPRAEAYDPQTVHRLRRLRAQRAASRAG